MDRQIETHFDGHGLNESIRLEADALDGSGASHRYIAIIGDEVVADIQFQQGPRLEPSSHPGVTEAVLLAILADRMEGFNKGPYSCRENSLVLTKVQEALHWTKHRADERAKRGVLGKNVK